MSSVHIPTLLWAVVIVFIVLVVYHLLVNRG
jgi:hypothetical protein